MVAAGVDELSLPAHPAPLPAVVPLPRQLVLEGHDVAPAVALLGGQGEAEAGVGGEVEVQRARRALRREARAAQRRRVQVPVEDSHRAVLLLPHAEVRPARATSDAVVCRHPFRLGPATALPS